MRHSITVLLAASLLLGSTAAWTEGAFAAKPRARRHSSAYSVREVRHAFAAAGDPLVDTGFGAFGGPVTVLTSVKARAGWTATIYIYRTKRAATSSYRGSRTAWRKSGVVARLAKNLVVTASRAGSGARAKRSSAIPPRMRKALALIHSRK